MNQHRPIRTGREAASEARFAVVERDVSWLRTPLNWRLRIYGQGVGGYAPAEGSESRYAEKADADRAGRIWLESGIYPAHQDRRASGSQANGG